MKVKKSKKIKSLTDHEKLINLIAVQGEKDIGKLLSSIDRVFIELFNPGTTAVDIGGWYATDDASELTKHQIPSDSSNTIIPAGGYLVLWASGETSRGALHVDFKLKKGGEFIGLVLSDGVTVVDSLTFGSQTDDISYGSCLLYTSPSPRDS